MSSWRGKITISGEWIEGIYDSAMVIHFLEDVVTIMTSIVSSNERGIAFSKLNDYKWQVKERSII